MWDGWMDVAHESFVMDERGGGGERDRERGRRRHRRKRQPAEANFRIDLFVQVFVRRILRLIHASETCRLRVCVSFEFILVLEVSGIGRKLPEHVSTSIVQSYPAVSCVCRLVFFTF